MKYVVEVWETRQHWIELDADDEEQAVELALENFPGGSVRDEYVSVEKREVYLKNG